MAKPTLYPPHCHLQPSIAGQMGQGEKKGMREKTKEEADKEKQRRPKEEDEADWGAKVMREKGKREKGGEF